MGKFIYAVMMVFVVELALWLFAAPGLAESSLIELFANPQNFLSNTLYATVIIITLTAFAASVIIPGNFYQINIYALYAGVAVVFITFTASLVHLWIFLNGQLAGKITPELSFVIQAIIVAPLFGFYLIAILEWVRSNQ